MNLHLTYFYITYTISYLGTLYFIKCEHPKVIHKCFFLTLEIYILYNKLQ